MTILEYLHNKYGTERIDSILDRINHGDLNFKLFNQHITVTDIAYTDDIHQYHSSIVTQLNEIVSDKKMLYELVNILSRFDFTFKRFNTCITYGTYDLFHYGHLRLLTRIKTMCSTLIVGVSSDEFNLRKGKKCVIPYQQRADIIGSLKCVDRVIPEESWEQKATDIVTYRADALVMGSDWTGKFDYLHDKCEVIYLPRTEGISTTELKQTLSNQYS